MISQNFSENRRALSFAKEFTYHFFMGATEYQTIQCQINFFFPDTKLPNLQPVRMTEMFKIYMTNHAENINYNK